MTRFFREDVRDLESVRDLASIQALADLLPVCDARSRFEAKLRETRIDPALTYFRDRLRIPWTYQVTLEGTRDFTEDGVRCLPARLFLGALV